MPTWYQGTIKYHKEVILPSRTGDLTKLKPITEAYLFDAVSYTEAEGRLLEVVPANRPDFAVSRIAKQPYSDLFRHATGDSWWRIKVVFSTEDARGREKKIVNTVLINADTAKQAYERIEENLKPILMPFEITDIGLTALLDVYQFEAADPET